MKFFLNCLMSEVTNARANSFNYVTANSKGSFNIVSRCHSGSTSMDSSTDLADEVTVDIVDFTTVASATATSNDDFTRLFF